MNTDSRQLISLTFDDALDEHLDKAVPMLNERGLRATFYVHLSASSFAQRLDEWKRAAQAGHELGNHTIFHPADARKAWVRHGNSLDEYFPDRVLLEIEVANQWLDAIDGGKPRSFAYPCSNPVLGKYGLTNRALFRMGLRNTRWPGLAERMKLDFGSTRQSYLPQIRALFPAARVAGLHLEQATPVLSAIDRHLLPSAAVENHSVEVMKGFIERSLAVGGWPILQFHGVGGGHHMDCDVQSFEALVGWLAERHRDAVVTVVEGARSVFASTTVTRSSGSRD